MYIYVSNERKLLLESRDLAIFFLHATCFCISAVVVRDWPSRMACFENQNFVAFY